MEINKRAPASKLLWVDLEMTGLNPEQHVIIEVAAIVTDWNWNILGEYEAVIHHADAVIEESNEWARNQHENSGLLDRVRRSDKNDQVVEYEFAKFIRKQFGDEPAVLAGNSIHNDRVFIRKWWPEVENLLHYRMLDVSSWKLVMQGKYDIEYNKDENHLAKGDIEASLAELRYYLNWLKTNQNII